jgi:hypothetical protein
MKRRRSARVQVFKEGRIIITGGLLADDIRDGGGGCSGASVAADGD